MESKERLVAALEGKPCDRLPFAPFLAYVWETLPEETRARGMLEFHRRIGADPLWRGAPCPVVAVPPAGLETQTIEQDGRATTRIRTPVGELRLERLKSHVGHTDFLVEHPLKRQEDYGVQLWIEENTRFEYRPERVSDHFAGNGREGLSLGMLLPRGKSAFQSLVEHYSGTEQLIYALADFPEIVEALWRVMVKKDLEAVRLAVQSGYDYFISWEDSSSQNYSPKQYDRYIASEIGEWCRILSARGKRYVQHACGHVRALVGRMAAHGVHAVESISPPPTGNITIADARQAIGSRMGIIGGIEPTRFLNLSEQDLRPYVESVIEEARGGPFILANSDSCPPGVTVEKFQIVADIARRTAWPG